MLLLSQTLTALEKQWILAQAAKVGDDYHLDKCGPTSLSQAGPSQEEDGEGNLDSQFQWEIRQYLCMT
jgi:hypothetical protein